MPVSSSIPVSITSFFHLREKTNPTTCSFWTTSRLLSTVLESRMNICITFGSLRLDLTRTLVSNSSASNPASPLLNLLFLVVTNAAGSVFFNKGYLTCKDVWVSFTIGFRKKIILRKSNVSSHPSLAQERLGPTNVINQNVFYTDIITLLAIFLLSSLTTSENPFSLRLLRSIDLY